MRVFFYIKKIINLLVYLRNPQNFIYLLFHYLRKKVPLKYARIIAYRNEKQYRKDNVLDIKIKTYDGSNQCVHPDIIVWKEKIYLVITPYPYGMEEYENPSIYFGDDLMNMVEFYKNPIDKPLFQDYGYHLSDPCLLKDSQSLYCAYRITKETKDKILLKKYLKEGKWEKEKILMESEKDLLLSPTMAFVNDRIIAYHICIEDEKNEKSKIIYTIFNKDMKIISSKEVKCKNIPEDYYVWHIGIDFNDISIESERNKEVKGIFLLKNKKNDYKLFKATSLGLSGEWIIEQEYKFDLNLKLIMKEPYKACFIPKTQKILMSYKDKKNRYRLTII